jgi:hypothetical protein
MLSTVGESPVLKMEAEFIQLLVGKGTNEEVVGTVQDAAQTGAPNAQLIVFPAEYTQSSR